MSSGEDSFNSSIEHEDSSPFTSLLKTDGEVCFGCGGPITDRYLLKVSGRTWHLQCLRCSVCDVSLDRQSSCFIKEDNIYCKNDYGRQFGTKCSKCLRPIQSTDWVRRAKDHVYHLACFACDSCKRQLSTGEEFALQDNRVLCKTHYIEVIEGGPQSDESSGTKQKTKRVRTTFSEDQIQILQANFQLDSNPDGQDLERIAQITGLSKRVTQVWFQNSRARQKKHQNQQNKINNMVTNSGTTTSPTSLGNAQQQQQQKHHHQRQMSPMTSPPGVMGAHSNSTYNNNHINNTLSNGLHVTMMDTMDMSGCSSMTATSPDSAGDYCEDDDYIMDTKPRLIY